MEMNSQMFEFEKMLNDLKIAIIVFHGDSAHEIHPVFCNESFLKLSGFTQEQFKSNLIKDQLYFVHPDDIESARNCFREALISKKPIECEFRVKDSGKKSYKWVSMRAFFRNSKDKSYDMYAAFFDINNRINTEKIIKERYQNIIEKEKNSDDNLLVVHMNITKDKCEQVKKNISWNYTPSANDSINDFIKAANLNIADENHRKQFEKNFSKESLEKLFERGFLNFKQNIPIRLSDDRIVWAQHFTHITRNPETRDLECVIQLKDDNKKIRIKESLTTIMKNDYEFIANMNVKTGLVSILNFENDRGIQFKEGGQFYHNDVLRERIEHIVEKEFVENCIQALSIETIVNELKNKKVYIVTYPASIQSLGHEGAFQWRFSYIDESQEEVVFTRNEVFHLLQDKQKVQIKLSKVQKQINKIAEDAKKGYSKRNKIIIADDSDINREMLCMIFEGMFEIIKVADGEEAIKKIDENYESLAIIMLDMQMPKKTGLDVIIYLKMRKLTDYIPVMLITGSSTKDLNLRSLEYGISDIVTKPFDSKIVKRRALNLIELYAHKEEVESQLKIWKEDAIKLQSMAEKNNELLINALSSVVEFRSIESGTHIKRVRNLTEIMLKVWKLIDDSVNLSEFDIEQIARASTMHDIGKVGIPDNILLKPGRLTPEEFDIMKTHTTLGCELLNQFKQEDSDFFKYCYDICRYHHERYDGKGYPDGLSGDKIPFWAQIVSIVDVFDALISPRVYKAAFSYDKAIEMIQNGECGCFSPKLLQCFEAAKDMVIAESKKMSAQAN